MTRISKSDLKFKVVESIKPIVIEKPIETEKLLRHFDRILEGDGDVCFIMGVPGIGKTTFVEHAIKKLVMSDVHCIYGKFRKNENKPFSALSDLIEHAIKQLLTLPLEQLESVKKTLMSAVGSDIEFIASLTPYLEKLLGTFQMVSRRDYVIKSCHVEKVLYDFLLAVSGYLFPLIVFVDDLQWADRASRDVLKYFCENYERSDFLLLMTSRSYEMANLSVVAECITPFSEHKIEIKPLSYKNIVKYIGFVLGDNIQNMKRLVRFLYGTTLGNPFFIRELLIVFIDEEVLSYSDEQHCWLVDVEAMEKFTMLPDVQSILIQKLEQLSQEDWEFLNVLACLDGIAEYVFLMKMVGLEEMTMSIKVNKLCENGLITMIDSDEYSDRSDVTILMHDIISEHIYRKIPQAKRAKMHTRIAMQLTESNLKFYFERDQLALTSQIVRSDTNTLIKDSDKWVVELYHAGLAVKKTTVIDEALKIFEMCEYLLPYSNLNGKSLLERKIQFELGECEFLLEQYDQANERFKKLMAKSNTNKDLIEIKCKYMDLYVYRGHSEKVIEMGMDVLENLDFDMTMTQLNSDAIRIKQLFSENKIRMLKDASDIKDVRLLQILDTLTKMAPAAYFTDSKRFMFILMKIGEISAVHGNSPYAPIGYVGNSFVQYNLWKNFDNGKLLMNVALELLETEEVISTKSIVYFLIGTFLKHRSASITDTIQNLLRAIDEGILSGKYLYCGYSVTGIINSKYVMGTSLTELSKAMAYYKRQMAWMDRNTMQYIQETYENHIDCLRNEGLAEVKNISDISEVVPDSTKLLTQELFRLQRLYLMGNSSEAIRLTERIAPNVKLLNGYILYPDILLFSILTRALVHNQYTGNEQQRNLKIMKALLDEFKDWIEPYSENHYARMILAQVEYMRCLKQNERLDQWYNEAIEVSEQNGQIHILALSNLLAARYHGKSSRLSNYYAREAENHFSRWGAEHITALIRKEFSLGDKISQDDLDTSLSSLAPEEVAVNFPKEKLSIRLDSMDEAQGFIYILNFLARYSHAEYAAILLEKSDLMYLQYEKRRDEHVVVHTNLININHVSHLSRRIIRYSARTGEDFVLSENQNNGIVAFDPYIMAHDEISIVCAPIRHAGVLVGLLYFEKKCKNGFDEHFVEQIKVMMPFLIFKKSLSENKVLKDQRSSYMANQLLTEREQEVLELLSEGLSNSEISKKLHITLGTVKNHLSNIYGKLEVESRIQAVIRAKELGRLTD